MSALYRFVFVSTMECKAEPEQKGPGEAMIRKMCREHPPLPVADPGEQCWICHLVRVRRAAKRFADAYYKKSVEEEQAAYGALREILEAEL